MVRLTLALVATSQVLAGAALAQSAGRTICSEPVKPTCVTSEITYEDQQRINRCRRDVERFEKDVEDYIACLMNKVENQRTRIEEVRETFEKRAGEGQKEDSGS